MKLTKKLPGTINKIISLLFCLAVSSAAIASDTTRDIYPEDKIKDQVNQNRWHYYKLELDTPAKLTIKLRKLSADVDLYVAKEQKPTEAAFLCAPKKPGKRIETCRLNSTETDVIYIGIYGKADSDYQLGVSAHEQELVSWSDYK